MPQNVSIGSFEIRDCGEYSINRAEAIAVLRELSNLHTEIAFSELVEINQLNKNHEFELKFKCVLDTHGRKSINEFLEKRNLKMKEENGFVIVHQ